MTISKLDYEYCLTDFDAQALLSAGEISIWILLMSDNFLVLYECILKIRISFLIE